MVVVVVDTENVRFGAVKQLAFVILVISVFGGYVSAVFEFVVLFAPNIDCNVKVADIDTEGRQNVEFEAEIEAQREVDVESHIFRHLELALQVAEQCSEYVTECLVDACVTVTECAVYPDVELSRVFESRDFGLVCYLYVVTMILLVCDLLEDSHFDVRILVAGGIVESVVDLLVVVVSKVDLARLQEEASAKRQ